MLDVDRSLQCRKCPADRKKTPALHRWSFMRYESEATAAVAEALPPELLPNDSRELRVNFECVGCESIHLAVPLPKGWSVDDEIVKLHFDELPCWIRQTRSATPRKTRAVVDGARGSPVEVASSQTAAARTGSPACRHGPSGGAVGAGEGAGSGGGGSLDEVAVLETAASRNASTACADARSGGTVGAGKGAGAGRGLERLGKSTGKGKGGASVTPDRKRYVQTCHM